MQRKYLRILYQKKSLFTIFLRKKIGAKMNFFKLVQNCTKNVYFDEKNYCNDMYFNVIIIINTIFIPRADMTRYIVINFERTHK